MSIDLKYTSEGGNIIFKQTSGGGGMKMIKPIVTTGLVFNLDAANKSSYPGSGDVWYDVSGNGVNGGLSGITYSSANDGCFIFNGTSSNVSLGSSLIYPSIAVDYITMEAWVMADVNTYGYLFSRQYSSAFNNLPYSLNVGGNSSSTSIDGIGFIIGNQWKNSGINYDIRGTELWYQVVGTFDGSTLKYYLNGELDRSSTEGTGLVLPKNNFNLWLGFTPATSYWERVNRYFGGKMAIARMYNRALLPAEILQNYDASRTRFGI